MTSRSRKPWLQLQKVLSDEQLQSILDDHLDAIKEEQADTNESCSPNHGANSRLPAQNQQKPPVEISEHESTTERLTESSDLGSLSDDEEGENQNKPVFESDGSVLFFNYDDETSLDGSRSISSSRFSITSRAQHDEDELSWRLNPSESLSDWKLVVHNKDSQTTESYHVHKSILGVGKRKSEYFINVFHRDGSSERTTKVTFPGAAASAVPLLLDYVYTGNTKKLNLSSETAPGLRYLSQFFGIRRLFQKVMQFIQKDLTLRNMVKYYKNSQSLNDKRVMVIAAKHCARNIHLIDANHAILEAMDPPFFARVIVSPVLSGVEKRAHVSVLVAKYCNLHKHTLDESYFQNVTSEENLPKVHHTAALSLMGLEADIVMGTSLKSIMSMTSLQERCIDSLAGHWRELSEAEPEWTASVCRKLPSFVVTELLLRSLESAKKDAPAPIPHTPRATKREQGRNRASNQDEAMLRNLHAEKIKDIKEDYELKISHLQELAAEKDKCIRDYYNELGKFKRLPNAHKGKIARSGRHLQPSIMPDVGKHESDGLVYATGRKAGHKNYPLFYYENESVN